MINLGSYSGKGMPNVCIRIAPLDWIMEGISVFIVIGSWILTAIFYSQTANPKTLLYSAGIITAITILFICMNRCPIRYYNFPVKLTEKNYIYQYRLAIRLCRIINIQINLLILIHFLAQMTTTINIKPEIIQILPGIIIPGILLITLSIYYTIAYRHK